MGKHEQGYQRIDEDFYPTPPWPVLALGEHINLKGKGIWEPACGDGRMALALVEAGALFSYATDIVDRGYLGFRGALDFTSDREPGEVDYDGIVTNPPFGERGKLAEAFIECGLRRIRQRAGRFMALLLPSDFDSAVTRARYFEACPEFVGKITLRKRIKFFDRPVPCRACAGSGRARRKPCEKCGGAGAKMVGPKENHCWAWWSTDHAQLRQGGPRIFYGPKVQQPQASPGPN